MIDAKEARRQSLLNAKCVDILNEVETQIMKAVKFGKESTTIHPVRISPEVVDLVKGELERLGYKVTFAWARPCPSGCPSDQWYSENELTVSWKLKESEEKK